MAAVLPAIVVVAGWLVLLTLYGGARRGRRRDGFAVLGSCLVLFGAVMAVRAERVDTRGSRQERLERESTAEQLRWMAEDLVNPVNEARRAELVLEYRGFKKAIGRLGGQCMPSRSACMGDLLDLGVGLDNGAGAALLLQAFTSGKDCDPAAVAAARTVLR